jgi:hypothetical protein
MVGLKSKSQGTTAPPLKTALGHHLLHRHHLKEPYQPLQTLLPPRPIDFDSGWEVVTGPGALRSLTVFRPDDSSSQSLAQGWRASPSSFFSCLVNLHTASTGQLVISGSLHEARASPSPVADSSIAAPIADATKVVLGNLKGLSPISAC